MENNRSPKSGFKKSLEVVRPKRGTSMANAIEKQNARDAVNVENGKKLDQVIELLKTLLSSEVKGKK
jgi:hypothetical protein